MAEKRADPNNKLKILNFQDTHIELSISVIRVIIKLLKICWQGHEQRGADKEDGSAAGGDDDRESRKARERERRRRRRRLARRGNHAVEAGGLEDGADPRAHQSVYEPHAVSMMQT